MAPAICSQIGQNMVSDLNAVVHNRSRCDNSPEFGGIVAHSGYIVHKGIRISFDKIWRGWRKCFSRTSGT